MKSNAYFDLPCTYRITEAMYQALSEYRDAAFDAMVNERDTFGDDIGMFCGGYRVIDKFLDIKYWGYIEKALAAHLPEYFNLKGGDR